MCKRNLWLKAERTEEQNVDEQKFRDHNLLFKGKVSHQVNKFRPFVLLNFEILSFRRFVIRLFVPKLCKKKMTNSYFFDQTTYLWGIMHILRDEILVNSRFWETRFWGHGILENGFLGNVIQSESGKALIIICKISAH